MYHNDNLVRSHQISHTEKLEQPFQFLVPLDSPILLSRKEDLFFRKSQKDMLLHPQKRSVIDDRYEQHLTESQLVFGRSLSNRVKP